MITYISCTGKAMTLQNANSASSQELVLLWDSAHASYNESCTMTCIYVYGDTSVGEGVGGTAGACAQILVAVTVTTTMSVTV